VNSIIARFCDRCGHQFAEEQSVGDAFGEASTFTVKLDKSASVPSEGERKTVSAMFADIKSSVELMASIDAEDAQAIVDPALQIMVDAVQFYDGYVVQILGDGVFALFGAPVAYEDHARRATYAAVEMQRALRSYGSWLERQGKPRIVVRVGVNSGDVVLRTLNTGGRLEYMAIGHTINLAARLQSVAEPGSITVSDATRRLVEGYFEIKGPLLVPVKGVSEPVAAFEVAGLGETRRHLQVAMTKGFTRFVNRERPIEVMQQALGQAIDGAGQTIAIVSEAGGGKSRLLFEFSRIVPPNCRILEAYALSHAKEVPWVPVVDMLTTYFDIRSADEPATRRQKVGAGLIELDPSLADAQPYLHELLGIVEVDDPLSQTHPLVKRARTLDAVKRIIAAESSKHPLVLFFEDLHWADAQSKGLLDLLAASVAETRTLLVVTSRPELVAAWRDKTNYSEIALSALNEKQSEQLLASLTHAPQIAPAIQRSIIERADGNPFFIEEIVQSLREDDSLALQSSLPPSAGAQLRVPQTVQATLAERVDRLPAHQKELLQTLAVIGTRLPLELVAAVSGMGGQRVMNLMIELEHSDFIYPQTSAEQTQYAFKHVLTQEVTYQSLVGARRKRLHEAVGRAIETLYVNSLGDHIGELAHHYSRSNNAAKAVEYLGRLGELAIQRSAHTEAVDSLRFALGLVETLPDSPERWAQETRLWLGLGVALQTSLGYAAPEVAEAYEKATALSERTGDVSLLVPAITGHIIFSGVRADYDATVRLAERLSTLDDPTERYAFDWIMPLGMAAAYTGKQKAAEGYFLKALAVAGKTGPFEAIHLVGPSRTNTLSYLAVTKWYLGYPDQAVARSEEALALAEQLSTPFTLVQTQGMHALLHHTALERAFAEQWIDKTIAGATAGGFPYWQMFGLLMKSSIMVDSGAADAGLLQFDHVFAAYRGSGARIGAPWLLALRAEMLAKMGRFEDGLAAVEEALACVRETGECYHEPEVHRLKGELLLSQGGEDAAARAEAAFRTSLEIARAQETKMLELRTATSLARLTLQQGRGKEAFDQLASVYGWFTEGLDSKDLKQAGALLTELSGLL
jgi:class 3 adenylate cyclase/predicted ATPase